MPDFNKIIAEAKAQRQAATNIPANPNMTSDQIFQAKMKTLQERGEIIANKNKPKFTGDASTIQAYDNNDQNAIQNDVNRNYADKNMVSNEALNDVQNPYEDPNAKDIGYLYDNAIDKMGKSLAGGVGDVLQGWGDALQFATSLGYLAGDGLDNNLLQVLGQQINEANAMDTDIDFSADNLTLGSLLSSSEFWLTQAPKVIPQLADAILAGKGAGALVKRAEKLGAKVLLKESAETAGKFAAKEGRVMSALKAGKVGGTVENVHDIGKLGTQTALGKGEGWVGALYNDRGMLNKTLAEVMQNNTAGLLMNAKLGMQNGTEMFNTYSQLKDEKGNNLFTKEEAAEMARNTFGNQLMYAPVDMLTYSMTFGSNKYVGEALRNSENGLLKGISTGFAKSQKYLVGRGAKVAGIAGAEGVEEAFQESFEEFAKLKAFYNKTGSYDNYQGIKPASLKGNKDLSFSDYLEFFSSDENQTLRNLSGALGAVMGGTFNLKTVFNKQAEQAADAYSRGESIAKAQAIGTKGAVEQDIHLRNVIAEAVMQNRDEHLGGFLSNLQSKGILTDQQLEYYSKIYEQTVAEKENIQHINSLSGKKAYMMNHANEMAASQDLENAIEQSNQNLAFHRANISDPVKLKQAISTEMSVLRRKIADQSKIILASRDNKEQLLAGKAASETVVKSKIKGGVELDTNFFKDKTNEYFKRFQRNQIHFQEQLELKAKIFQEQQEQAKMEEEAKLKAKEEMKAKRKSLQEGQLAEINKEADTQISAIDEEINTLNQEEVTPEIEEKIKGLEEQKATIEQDRQDKLEGAKTLAEMSTVESKNKDTNEGVSKEALDIAEKWALVNDGTIDDSQLSDEEMDYEDNNPEEFAKAEKIIAQIKSAIDILTRPAQKDQNGKDVKPSLEQGSFDILANNKELFLRLAKNQGIDNAAKLLADHFAEVNSLNESEKAFVEGVKAPKAESKFSKFKKNLKRKASEFIDNNDGLGELVDNINSKNGKIRFKLDGDENTNQETNNYSKDDSKDKLTPEEKAVFDAKDYLKEFIEKGTLSNKKIDTILKNKEAINLNPELEAKLKALKDNGIKEKVKENLQLFKSAAAQRASKAISSVLSKKDDLSHLKYNNRTLVERIHAQDAVNRLYPNSNISIVVADDISRFIGYKALASAVEGVIYVDTKSWQNNNRDFFHEMAHIHFALSKDTDATKDLVKVFLQNEKLLNDIKKAYHLQVLYEIDGVKAYKGDIIRQALEGFEGDVNRDDIEKSWNQLLADNKVKELPIEEQDVIIDEMFAAGMEATWNNEFKNKMFEQYTEAEREAIESPKVNPKRQSKTSKLLEKYTPYGWYKKLINATKKWYSAIQENAKGKSKDQTTDEYLLDQILSMDEDQQKDFRDLKTKVTEAFLGGNVQNWSNPDIRFKLDQEMDQEYNDILSSTRTKIDKSVDEHVFNKRVDVFEDTELTEEEKAEQAQEDDLADDNESREVNDDLFNTDRMRALQKTTGLIKKFSELYNKGLRRNFFLSKGSENSSWRNVPTFDGDQLLVDLYQLASDVNSSEEFIAEIENSESEVMQSFNDFMDKTRADKYAYLNSFWMLGKDVGVVDSVQAYVNTDGKYEIQSSMNMKENAQYDRNFNKVLQTYKAFYDFSNGKMSPTNRDFKMFNAINNYDVLNEAIKNIQQGTMTNEDIYRVGSFFGVSEDMFNENKIYIDGRKVALDKAIVGLARRLGNNDSVYIPNFKNEKGQREVMPAIIKFMRGAVVSNRKFSADFTVLNAEGNQTPSRVVKGHINRKIEDMNKDALSLSRKKFIDKYTRTKGVGTYSNNLLGFMYDNAQKGKEITLSQFNGIKNDKDNSYTTFDQNNANDNSLMEFITFATSTNGNSYIMETGRYADSPISYMMEVPMKKMSQFGKFDPKTGKFAFGSKTAKEFMHAVATYNSFFPKDKKTAVEIKANLENSIQEEIEFLSQNADALKAIKGVNNLIEDNGNLNEVGKKAVASYVINNWINGMNFNQVFLPDVSGKDFVKRAKGLRAPGYSMGKNVKFENVYYIDDVQTELVFDEDGKPVMDEKTGKQKERVVTEYDDSAMYILEDDAERIEAAFGNILKVGKGYKLLINGMEMDNPNFKGTNFYDKGYTTILNEEYVRDNPRLAGLYNTMLRRRQKLGDLAYKPLTGANMSSLVLATPLSANKMKGINLPSDIKNMTLDFLGNPENDLAVQDMYNNLYHPKGKFVGLSGQNLVLQQKMDNNNRYEANTAIQEIKAILAESSVHGNRTELESILSDLAQLEQEQLDKFMSNLNQSPEKVLEFFEKELISKDDIDTLQKFLLEDGMSINTPAVRSLAVNTFLNHIRKNGNKYLAPGTIAQQKPSNKYEKNVVMPNGDRIYYATKTGKGLSFYTKNQDGSHRPGEAIIPKYLAKNVRVRQPRLFYEAGINTQYFVPNNDPNAISRYPNDVVRYADGLLKKAKSFKAVDQNMGVDEFIELHSIYDLNDDGSVTNKVIGLYIPGDMIKATRVPSHGVQSTGFFEAVGIDATGASNVQLPTEFAQKITGGDYDGDQVFIQHKGKKNDLWNSIFDRMKDRWLSKEMSEEVVKEIDFAEDAEEAIKYAEEVLGTKLGNNNLMSTPAFRRQAFNDTTVSKNNVGAVANYHSYASLFSTYNTPFSFDITIDGRTVNKFSEAHDTNRSINSAKLMNIILDNAKEQYADKLGINQETVGDAVILTQLGFSLPQIAAVLNSETYVDYVNKKRSTRNTFAPNEQIDEIKTDEPIEINTKNLKDGSQSENILALIKGLSQIKSDMSDISSIMSGHTRIESDPFILTQQLNDLEALLENRKSGQVIEVSSELRYNPLLQNYINTAKTALEVQERYDPTSRPDLKDVYGNVTSSSTKNISKNQKRKIREDLEKFTTSRLLGWNNIPQSYKEGLVDSKNPLNIYDRIEAHIQYLKNDIIGAKNVYNTKSAYDNSLLFTKALAISTSGNSKYISIRPSFFDATMTEMERTRVREEFMALDEDLRNDLLIYDMISNGWKGPKSLFHIAGKDFMKKVSNAADSDIKNKNNDKISNTNKDELQFALAELNQSMFPNVTTNPFHSRSKGHRIENIGGNRKMGGAPADLTFNQFLFDKDGVGRNMLNKMKRGEPITMFYFEKGENGKGGQKFYFNFKGLTPQQMDQVNRYKAFGDKAFLAYLNGNMGEFIKNGQITVRLAKDSYKSDIGYERITSVSDSKSKPNGPEPKTTKEEAVAELFKNFTFDPNKSSFKNSTYGKTRNKLDDWYNYSNGLTRGEFDQVMEFEDFYNESDKDLSYKKYLSAKRLADGVFKTINPDTVKGMTNEQLINHFEEYGELNQYAYANVMKAVTMELAQRISEDQTKNYTQIEEDGMDIGPTKKWLMANNIPSNHPMVQGLVRNMENQFKNFTQEKSKYQNRLNNATNALYKEKLGYLVANGSIMDKIKALYDYLFTNKEGLYNKLYGNLITYDMVQQTAPDGRPYTMKVMKYKPKEEIEMEYKKGTLSKAEYDFYNETSNISEDLVRFGNLKNGKRADYIPHTAPGQMEAFSRRGLMGLLMTSKTLDHRIKDVRMKFKHPVTGEMKTMSFGEIDFLYDLANSEKTIRRNPQEYYMLKKEAIKLLKQGRNQDGTPIRFSDIDMGTAIGDTFVNRFTNSASRSSNNFTSLDLNKAFSDYIHTSLFTNGNENFAGMKKMLPMVDGVLAQLDTKGMKNMSAYVKTIWKDNFLKGAKQRSIKTPAMLEAAGISSDSVVDFITKGSLVYWLGYKGLATGYGLYAVGNALSGKFANIANQGGKDWIRGEKRFWLGKDGKFDIKDPFKGVKEATEMMNKGGFMNINLFDEVGTTNLNSGENMLMSMALTPMIYSEKWIQGVHFLGMLSNEEWDLVRNGGKLPVERLNEIENQVKLAHGKGFQPTDQRMIQMYSWGRMMLQFSRHIPTMFYNAFAGKDKDIYGKTHIGNYRQLASTIQNVVTGAWTPEKFKAYYKTLDDVEKRKLKSGLMGFGLLAGVGAMGVSGVQNKYANDLASDANIFFDTDRLGYKMMTPPALGMMQKFM